MILWHTGTTLAVLWFVFRGNTRLDYRVAVAGALLPDITDKLVGRILFRRTFESGRIFGHSLLLNVAFFAILFFLRGRKKRKLVLLPIGSLLHLAEDGMWSVPQVFWWPLFGWRFPRDPHPGLFDFLIDPLASPPVLVQEAIGGILVLWLLAAHRMLDREGIRTFVRTGHLETDRR